jgi:S-adenosylmethionine/arginine decarboxylase-like enzyme
MNNFPFYQHYAAKLIFSPGVLIDENLVDQIANLLVDNLKLTVVGGGEHQFPRQGLTKFWILSQSHLIIHTWPENSALHLDLLTCSPAIIAPETLKSCFSSLSLKDIVISRLDH